MPRSLVQWYVTLSSSFCEKALAIAGAKNARMVYVEAESEGVRDGEALFRLHFDITWR